MLINPALTYEVLNQYYYDTLKTSWIFENSNRNEILYIALQMRLKIMMSDEKVITQGDNDKQLYIIMIGHVKVYMKKQINQTTT